MSDVMNRTTNEIKQFLMKSKCEQIWRSHKIAYPMHVAGWKESGNFLMKIKCRILSPINRWPGYLNRIRRYMVTGK